jgi:hypothetical protein
MLPALAEIVTSVYIPSNPIDQPDELRIYGRRHAKLYPLKPSYTAMNEPSIARNSRHGHSPSPMVSVKKSLLSVLVS